MDFIIDMAQFRFETVNNLYCLTYFTLFLNAVRKKHTKDLAKKESLLELILKAYRIGSKSSEHDFVGCFYLQYPPF